MNAVCAVMISLLSSSLAAAPPDFHDQAERQQMPPWYEDRANVLSFLDDQGQLKPVRTADDWEHRVAHIRAGMELVMGALPGCSSVPLDARISSETRLRHYTRQHLTFTVEAGDQLPVWLLVPHQAGPQNRRPAMICLPESAAPGKDNPAGLTARADMAYGHELAERGYVCLIPDYPLLHASEYQTDPYVLGYHSATMKGIVNHRRAVDLLQSMPFVDETSIGVIGHSLGGHNALFLAVFEPRIRAVVSSCGFNVFAKHNGGDISAWSSHHYMPRIRTVYQDDPAKVPFDFTEVLAALAPRPVFINAPLHDLPDFEVSGVRDCIAAALPVYRDIFQAEECLQVRYPDADHQFPAAERQACYAFLDAHLLSPQEAVALDDGLAARWLSSGDQAQFVSGTSLEIPADQAPQLGKREFTLAMWLKSDPSAAALPGDLISQYDPATRRGFHLTLKSSPGTTTNQSNWRHLQFGIDNDRSTDWQDCGRPGNAVLAFALAVHEGALYAGTCEPGVEESGRVYRYAGDQQWIDCGSLDGSNSVTSLAVHEGVLYAGTGKYRLAGSSLTESANETPGGRVFRYDGGNRWSDCGQLSDTEAVGGLVVYRGQLYASSLYRPAGFFRYEGDSRWTTLPVPQGVDPATSAVTRRRVEAMTVYDGFLYASSYDGGHVYRYDGNEWTDCGRLGDNTQTYSFCQYEGRLHVGTWPSGRVFRFEDVNQWTDVGRLGEELEVMGMMVHNGRLLAGTLPLAEVYAYNGGDVWIRLTQLDHTPDVRYRRAWTMAEHDGQLFCSTLPSGRIYSFAAGQQVMWGHSLPGDWCHVAAVRSADQLTLYVNGEQVAQTPPFDGAEYELTTSAALKIGTGMNGPLNGRLADVRIYQRPLRAAEIQALSSVRPEAAAP